MKLRLCVAFALLGLSVASAKSYQITLDSASKAGDVTLKPGRYNVVLGASKVRFTDVNSGRSVEAEGKVVHSERKFGNTAVNATKVDDGTNQIQEILLGGTSTKIEFE